MDAWILRRLLQPPLRRPLRIWFGLLVLYGGRLPQLGSNLPPF